MNEEKGFKEFEENLRREHEIRHRIQQMKRQNNRLMRVSLVLMVLSAANLVFVLWRIYAR